MVTFDRRNILSRNSVREKQVYHQPVELMIKIDRWSQMRNISAMNPGKPETALQRVQAASYIEASNQGILPGCLICNE